MKTSDIIDNIQNHLADQGVYRTDTFLLDVVNDGYKLTAVIALFDERRATVSQSKTRNMANLYTGATGDMIAPLYVGGTTSGVRAQPVRLRDFDLYADEWEGQVGADVMYYTVLNPYCTAEAQLWCVPMPDDGALELRVVGAFVPADLAAGQTPRLPEDFQDILFWYGVFGGLASEPGRGREAGEAYGEFVGRTNELVQQLKARFPSDQGFRPRPVEFVYDVVSRQQQKGTSTEREDVG